MIFQKPMNSTWQNSLPRLVQWLTNVVRLLPKQAADYKDLPAPRACPGGRDWSELFDYDWLHNKYPALGVVVWYLFIFLLGFVVYPITRSAFAGLRQYAYPLSRMVGILLLAWISWMGGSIGVPYTRTSIGVIFALIGLAGFGLWMIAKNSSKRGMPAVVLHWGDCLCCLPIDLLIRLGTGCGIHPRAASGQWIFRISMRC
jgi:hypothetical protein